MKTYFITGTDTGVGKTYISCKLLKNLNKQNYQTCAFKPIESGGDDFKKLQQAASIKLEDRIINPYYFNNPIAPHIAAEEENIKITANNLAQHCLNYPEKLNIKYDYKIIEGAGGLLVPINYQETYLDFLKIIAQHTNLEVILVVNIKLGCINHTLLTAEILKINNLKLAGWVANCIEPYEYSEQNIETISKFLSQSPFSLFGIF